MALFLIPSLILPAITIAEHGVALQATAGKVDPYLRSLIDDFDRDGREVSLIVLSYEPLTDREILELNRFGFVQSIIGRIATIRTDPAAIAALSNLRFIERIEGSKTRRASLDASVPEIGAHMVWGHARDGRGLPIEGSGVIIGIIDTGIDLAHPDFRFPNGTSKILFVWDQTIGGRPPAGFIYGHECTRREIDEALCPEEDAHGHGTHVAGIAASSGLAAGEFKGVAPGSSIIFVKAGRPVCEGAFWTFGDAEVIDGVHYIAEKARRLGMRAVINLSLGGHIGGHEDTSAIEIALNELVDSGVAIVVSAGNEADKDIHSGGRLDQGASVTVGWSLRGAAKEVVVDLWYQPQDSLEVSVKTPKGEVVRGPTTATGIMTQAGLITISPGISAKGREWLIYIRSIEALQPDGWSLTLQASSVLSDGSWDAWIVSDSCEFPAERFLSQADPSKTIGVPGTASGVITVGAYVTKIGWTNKRGEKITASGEVVGSIASFSSRGPTRDGRVKPDITAPGIFIASAKSSRRASLGYDPDDHHTLLGGTSMSAPHVAGVVALMLQLNPSLTPRQVKAVLREGGRRDRFTGPIDPAEGSNVWGWGKVDALPASGMYRAVVVVEGLPGSLSTSIKVDGGPAGTISGGGQRDFAFIKGTIHTIEAEQLVFESNLARYRLTEAKITVSMGGVYRFVYVRQLYLTVRAPYGASGEGWYDEGVVARFSARKELPVPDLLGLLGAKQILAYWVDEEGSILSSPEILMDSPHTVAAVYRLEYPIPIAALLMAVLAAAATGPLTLWRRRKRPRTFRRKGRSTGMDS